MPKPRTELSPSILADIEAWLASRAARKKPTINDVAHFSGVSKKTVSRVINDASGVNTDTRALVQAVITELGFAPNRQARALALQHSFLIGLIYDNPNPEYVVNIQEGILESLTGSEFELALHRCDRNSPDFLTNIRRFIERQRLYGVILTPSASEDERLAELLRDLGCKYIRVACIDVDEKSHMITSNDKLGALAAARHLTTMGHKEIAIVLGRTGFRSTDERLAGFEQGLSEAGLRLQPQFMLQGDYTFQSGVSAGERILSARQRPTAIFASNDEMAAGILHAARMRGIKIPDALSVIGFDDFHVAARVWPRLTTVHSPTQEIGRLAAKKLLQKDDTPLIDETEPWLVIRDTVAAPPA